MKKLSINPAYVIGACLTSWALFLVSLFSLGSLTLTMISLLIAGLLTWPSIIMLFSYSSTKTLRGSVPTQGVVAKTLAVLTLLALVTSVYATSHSLHLSMGHGKFAYENVGTGAGFTAAVLVFVLSAIQNDIYWVSRKKAVKLDERQIRERQEVFETSYKIGAWVVLLAAFVLRGNAHGITQIIQGPINAYSALPGAFFWPFFDVAILLFALPLVVASLHSKKSK